MEDLLTRDFGATAALILEIVADPASRPLEALLIFGIVVALLTMILIVVLLSITKGEDDEGQELEQEEDAEAPAADVQAGALPTAVARRFRLPVVAVVSLALLGWWAATAAMTGATPVCLTCHQDNSHAASQAESDPHERVRCVRCHDGSGTFGSFTTAVPARVEHIVIGLLNEGPGGNYGSPERACASCHLEAISVTTENESKAVKMSHREPLAAGAACLDCHGASDGVVGLTTTSMQPCLRCHDGETAPAECSSCHTGDIALAVTGRSVLSTATAEPLVQEIDCGGCHPQDSCDACHGIRMPHTPEFMAYAHAREGVEDLWFNGGRTCGKCHTTSRRPCTSCHLGEFLSHGAGFRSVHSAGTSEGCDSCHSRLAYRNGRDFCGLCHTPAP